MAKLFENDEAAREKNSLDQLKELEDKIALAIGKVKVLKEEKIRLEARVRELENALNARDSELRHAITEKSSIKGQIQDLLSELESIEAL